MPNDIIGKICFVALAAWAFCMLGFWLYLMCGIIKSGGQSAKLLRQVREVSKQTFDYLHKGNINPAFEIVPFVVLNGSRFNAFIKSEELNEHANIKIAKVEWQKSSLNVKRNLRICAALFATGLVIFATVFAFIASGVLK